MGILFIQTDMLLFALAVRSSTRKANQSVAAAIAYRLRWQVTTGNIRRGMF